MPPTTHPAEAWSRLKKVYPDETWFGGTHLEENKPRLMLMLQDIATWHPPGSPARIVDVGCFNGFLPYLLSQLGYQTAGIDAISLDRVPERTKIMAEVRAPFYQSNFNHLDPFPDVPRGTFDVAILGEVIEHIFNHPVGLVRAIGSLLKPGGHLILTTPNPRTLANAVRLLRGHWICWGDGEFATMPKISAAGEILSFEDIHYREYGRDSLLDLIGQAGFAIGRHQYLGTGVAPHQPFLRRTIKSSPLWGQISRHRLFGLSHYVIAKRP